MCTELDNHYSMNDKENYVQKQARNKYSFGVMFVILMVTFQINDLISMMSL